MRLRLTSAILLLAMMIQGSDAQQGLAGYTPERSRTETLWEKRFRDVPERSEIRADMMHLSARPHHVGSPYDRQNAEWLLAKLKSYGLEGEIETFSALFPTPKMRKLELLGPVPFHAKLHLPPLAIDPTSGQTSEQLPPYNAYSRDGDVTAPLVYVNYGRPEDYDALARMGVSVKGMIVIARYGLNWRGVKVRIAAEHGAIGCILYSDPHEDGYFRGEPYPTGPMRSADGVQSGSVLDMPLRPGDPQSPDDVSPHGPQLIPLDKIETITKIPVLPISYADASPLLKSLQGETVPETWRGALPFTYRTGPSIAKVHLTVSFNWNRKPLYDVIARIPGASQPSQWVIRGNHHDAWVNGAGDPLSGASAELEEARALGQLLREGWRPQRTIFYCFWDGEEPGMLGSTAWAKAHATDLAQHAVAYFNTDGNGRGYLSAAGSHSLENFVSQVAKDIDDPETGMSVWERARLVQILNAPSPQARTELRARPDLRIPALGGGSDYIAFLDHLGIATIDLSYGGEDEAMGQYHSAYDDFYWYSHFEDTDFSYARVLAQTAGTMVMRIASADLLPFQFSDFANTVHLYVDQLKTLTTDMRDQTQEDNQEISEGVYRALYDPKKRMIPPLSQALPPDLNFKPLDQACSDLTTAAQLFDSAFIAAHGMAPSNVNAELIQSERALTDPRGLSGRPWFRHIIYAPGFYTGYEAKTLPGVREAIEQRRWKDADTQMLNVSAALEREADLLKQATDSLLSQK